MGLGKTLTMISLMLRHRELVEAGVISEDFSSLKEEDREGEEEDTKDSQGWISHKTHGNFYYTIHTTLFTFFTVGSTLFLIFFACCVCYFIYCMIVDTLN